MVSALVCASKQMGAYQLRLCACTKRAWCLYLTSDATEEREVSGGGVCV